MFTTTINGQVQSFNSEMSWVGFNTMLVNDHNMSVYFSSACTAEAVPSLTMSALWHNAKNTSISAYSHIRGWFKKK